MKLISAQIKNYSNVVNTKEFEIENVTCLAGKNIEGKTDTLKALTRLNPADPLEGNFSDPRCGSIAADSGERAENVVLTRWILMQDDIKMVEKYLGRRCLTSEVVTIRKGYRNELQWDIPINYDYFRSDSPETVSGNKYQLYRSDVPSISNLLHSLKPKSGPAESDKLVATDYRINRSTAKETGREILEKRLSRFLYSSVSDIIASDASLQDLIKKRGSDRYSAGERILLDWFALAGISPEEMLASADLESVAVRMSQLAESLCRKINQYWSHYNDLMFDFSFVPVVPKEPGDYSVDQQIRLRVVNRRTRLKESIDESRSGYLWFFSFLVKYTRACSNYGHNMVVVLDEPGMTETKRAQASLLTYFSRELTPKHQLIYSTHLASMIDPTLF